MQVKIMDSQVSTKIAQYRKEKGYTGGYQLIVDDGDTLRVICDVRFYFVGRDGMSPLYCVVWVNDNKTHTHKSGAGKASGCGYHKPSAALEYALNDAGIYTSEPISGVGNLAIVEALEALAEKLGYTKYILTDQHS